MQFVEIYKENLKGLQKEINVQERLEFFYLSLAEKLYFEKYGVFEGDEIIIRRFYQEVREGVESLYKKFNLGDFPRKKDDFCIKFGWERILKNSGFLDSSERFHTEITEEGEKVLENYLEKLSKS